MSQDRDALRRSFESVAELYDAARPTYSEELFDDLLAMRGSGHHPSSILEVGCGTGQASVPLARRGCDLVCVELGENLAEIARRNLAPYPNAEVVVGEFEQFDPKGERFDVVFSVSAWHWIDPAVGYRKAAEVLRPGGHLAIARVEHAFPEGFDPFFTEIQPAYDAINESAHSWPPPPPDQVPDDSAEIGASGLFGPVQVKRTLWAIDFTAQQYIDLLETFSGHIVMEESKRSYLYGRMRELIARRSSGTIRKHYLTILHVARVR